MVDNLAHLEIEKMDGEHFLTWGPCIKLLAYSISLNTIGRRTFQYAVQL